MIKKLAAAIDHTLLKADTTREEITALCAEAKEHRFAAVCVNPWHTALASRTLQGTGVAVAVVAGFPLGANTTAAKVFEAGEAVQNGATEIDLVINVAALKDGLERYVREEISRVKAATEGTLLKVIIETGLLKHEEKVIAVELAAQAGADMIKTSTGFHGGATTDDVRLIKELVSHLGIKASGGIRSAAFALELLTVGATRIGTSSAVTILQELQNKSEEE
ncbi:MAG: deoxyribose-phosphate aldolase [Bacillota bacterium]|nr:deoxyribose-phosphate aldolase [Bacillota bacterium]MDW7685168.1 deoxyribose-phosphate aldolase [Bacillota bacterium]